MIAKTTSPALWLSRARGSRACKIWNRTRRDQAFFTYQQPVGCVDVIQSVKKSPLVMLVGFSDKTNLHLFIITSISLLESDWKERLMSFLQVCYPV
jgi:hypothetical protein